MPVETHIIMKQKWLQIDCCTSENPFEWGPLLAAKIGPPGLILAVKSWSRGTSFVKILAKISLGTTFGEDQF